MNRHFFTRTLHVLYIVAATFWAASCASELDGSESGQKGTARVTISLGTSPHADELGNQRKATTSRAAWTDPMAEEEGEMIQTGHVVMVDNDSQSSTYRQVYRIFTLDLDGKSEVEQRDVTSVATTKGLYRFYAFANEGERIDDKNLSINGYTLTIGSKVPDGFEKSTIAATANYFQLQAPGTAGYTGIPMACMEDYAVSNDVTIRLYLYRRLSKMRFEFKNQSTKAATIRKITMGNVTSNNSEEQPSQLYLFPPLTSAGVVTNRFPSEPATPHSTETVTLYSDEVGLTIPADGTTLPLTAYINESVSDHVTTVFPLEVTLQRDGETDVEVRNALMKFSAIPRNTAAIVPITLTDYDVELRTFFYPPIGGYPTFEMDKNDGKYFSIIFQGGGDFTIRPFVFRLQDKDKPENWIDINDKSQIESYALTVEDPNRIFSTEPHFDGTTGEILGTLDPLVTSGMATVQLTLQIKVNDIITQVYNRTIYIIRK